MPLMIPWTTIMSPHVIPSSMLKNLRLLHCSVWRSYSIYLISYCPSWFNHGVILLQYILLCLVLYSYCFFFLPPTTKLLTLEWDSIWRWNFLLRTCISWLLKFKWALLYNSSGISQWWLQSQWFLFIPLKPQTTTSYETLQVSKCCFIRKFIPELVVGCLITLLH